MFPDLDQNELLSIVESGLGPAPLSEMTFEDVGAELSLRASRSEHGLGFADTLWERLKVEFRELVCGHGGKYHDLRSQFVNLGSKGTAAIVALFSSALAASIGSPAIVIAPVVALLALAVSRLGKEAFCTMNYLDDKPIPQTTTEK